jgi:hypothetical protein
MSFISNKLDVVNEREERTRYRFLLLEELQLVLHQGKLQFLPPDLSLARDVEK